MFMIGAGSTGFTVGSTRAISSQNPKSSAAPSGPSGAHRPKTRAARPGGGPPPEDQSPQRDVPEARADARDEAADRADSQVGAADTRHQPAEYDVAVADPQHTDSHRVGGGRVLADRADPQAPAAMEQGHLDDDDRGVRDVQEDGRIEKERG